MSKIVWDAVGEHLYETGVDQGVVYPQDAAGAYPAGYAWNGLTGVTESPSGAEPTDLWADNIKYLSLLSAEDFGLTIEAYTYPDEFANLDGTASPVNGLRIGQQTRKPFGFCYRSIVGNDTQSNDHGYKLHLIYNCKASPSEKAYSTVNDSPEAITFSWTVTTTPVTIGTVNNVKYKPTAQLIIDTTKLTTTEEKTRLAALETILYGSENSDASLPLPARVISILSGQGG